MVTPKLLAHIAPLATVETILYTVPAGKRVVVSVLVVANRGGVGDAFRIAHNVNGAATVNPDYLYYDVSLGANSTTEILRGICLAATDTVRVYAGTANLSFGLYGVEE